MFANKVITMDCSCCAQTKLLMPLELDDSAAEVPSYQARLPSYIVVATLEWQVWFAIPFMAVSKTLALNSPQNYSHLSKGMLCKLLGTPLFIKNSKACLGFKC
jgi:hypothetical protein